jgi:adenine-specific DNA-methyltransferase
MILLVLIGTASAGSGAASTPNATTPGTWVDVTPSNADLTDPLDCSNYGTGSVQVDAAHPGTLYSTERDFIYVTTASLSHEQLQQLSDEVGPERSLLVLCTAFRGRGDYPNLTVKKIPRQVLSRCEWGHDDYSLRVENLPKAPSVLESPLSPTLPHKGGGSKAEAAGQQGLFWDEPA